MNRISEPGDHVRGGPFGRTSTVRSGRPNRIAVAVVATALGALVLVGCGGGGGDDDNPLGIEGIGEGSGDVPSLTPSDDSDFDINDDVGELLEGDLLEGDDEPVGDEPRTLELSPETVTGFVPSSVATDGTTIWATDFDSGVVHAIDVASGDVVDELEVGTAPLGIAYANGNLWVANSDAFDHSIMRLDPKTGEVLARIETESGISPTGVAAGEDAIWVGVGGTGQVLRIDPATNTIEASITDKPKVSSGGTVDVLVAEGSVWSIDRMCGRVLRIDPATNAIAEQFDDLGFEASDPTTCTGSIAAQGPYRLAAHDGAVYVLSEVAGDQYLEGRVYRIDPATSEVSEELSVPTTNMSSATGLPGFYIEDDAMWLPFDGSVLRVDRATGRPDEALSPMASEATAFAEVGGTLWIGIEGISDPDSSGLYGLDLTEAADLAA
jgi:YVTN family beta-propeller protein